MRLRELPHVGDDIAAARAAGYRVLFEMHGTREGLVRAHSGTHPACPGIPARGVIWNGHGEDSGAVMAHDGEEIDPAELPGDIARFATARRFVLGCCSAGAHADRWRAALCGYAHVFGWPMPVDVATGIDLYTSDPGSQSDLDDLMLQHLGVRPSAPVRHAETRELLRLEWELAVFYGANPLAVDSRALAVGQRVLGQWRNGRYFPCVLGEFDGERFLARWDDGDEPTWLQPWQVRPEGATRSMRVPGALRIGAHCHARWTDGSFYPALLTDWNGSHLLARWDDGSPPLWIDPSNGGGTSSGPSWTACRLVLSEERLSRRKVTRSLQRRSPGKRSPGRGRGTFCTVSSLRIAVLSDLHVDTSIAPASWDLARCALKSAVRSGADHVVLAGDTFDCATAMLRDRAALQAYLVQLGLWHRDRLTVIVGNHDVHHTPPPRFEARARAGARPRPGGRSRRLARRVLCVGGSALRCEGLPLETGGLSDSQGARARYAVRRGHDARRRAPVRAGLLASPRR
jgi:hypothetical protein